MRAAISRCPTTRAQGALYEATQSRLAAAGLPAYEISNHARPGGECRHNLAYWRYEDYVGIGPGAHGRLTRDGQKFAARNFRAPETWLNAVETKGHGGEDEVALALAERRDEMLMMGLRLSEGVAAIALPARDRRRYRGRARPAPRAARSRADSLSSIKTGLRATASGRQRLNAVLAALLA